MQNNFEDQLEELKNKYVFYENDLKILNNFLYNNPELGNKEFLAKEKHLDLLLKNGFLEEKLNRNKKTAYLAKYISKNKGPVICYMSEYDALPDIGHGCGHNILGVVSIAAGLILKDYVDIYGGTVIVLGTPAEETNGAKVDMAKAGVFDTIDIAMISHPTSKGHYSSGSSQCMEALEIKFKGQTAHAAGNPSAGINALDAAVNFYVAMNSIKTQITSDGSICGIISNGGVAANIIPDVAILKYYVRAKNIEYLNVLVKKFKNCAKGIALATGTCFEINNYEYSFKNLVTNESLSEIYKKYLRLQGIKEIFIPNSKGSTDTGDVSHICPTIHPYFPLTSKDVSGHTVEFAKATINEEAYKGMKESVFSLVLTGIEILKDKEVLLKIKEEFIKTNELTKIKK
ncbi:MAG: M20 family metallopeptidase [Fusobacteriaceae bacterium]